MTHFSRWLGLGALALASCAEHPRVPEAPSIASRSVPRERAPNEWWLTPGRMLSPGVEAVQVFATGGDLLALGREHGAVVFGRGGSQRALDAARAAALDWILVDPPFVGDWLLGKTEETRSLVAIDVNRLEPAWEIPLDAGHEYVQLARGPNGALISTSAPDQSHLPRAHIAVSGKTGRVLWRLTDPDPGYLTSPMLATESGYWITRGTFEKGELQILDATSGKVRWSEKRKSVTRLLTNGRVVVVVASTSPGTVVMEAREAETGKLLKQELWNDQPAAALIEGNTLYLLGRTLRALELPNLNQRWEAAIAHEPLGSSAQRKPSFIAAEGAVVLCDGGTLRAFDQLSGAELWSYGLELAKCRSFAVAPGPRVYVARTKDLDGEGDDTIVEFTRSDTPPETATVHGTVSRYQDVGPVGATVVVGNTAIPVRQDGSYEATVKTRGVLRLHARLRMPDDDERCNPEAEAHAQLELNGKGEYRVDLELARECW